MSALSSLNPGADHTAQAHALAINVSAGKGLSEVLKSNLGPRGTLKMLVDGAGTWRGPCPGQTQAASVSVETPLACQQRGPPQVCDAHAPLPLAPPRRRCQVDQGRLRPPASDVRGWARRGGRRTAPLNPTPCPTPPPACSAPCARRPRPHRQIQHPTAIMIARTATAQDDETVRAACTAQRTVLQCTCPLEAAQPRPPTRRRRHRETARRQLSCSRGSC